jgi:hypothetical protein
MKKNKWIIILSALLVGLIVFLYWQDAEAKEQELYRKQDAITDAIQDDIDSMQRAHKLRRALDSLEIRRMELEAY